MEANGKECILIEDNEIIVIDIFLDIKTNLENAIKCKQHGFLKNLNYKMKIAAGIVLIILGGVIVDELLSYKENHGYKERVFYNPNMSFEQPQLAPYRNFNSPRNENGETSNMFNVDDIELPTQQQSNLQPQATEQMSVVKSEDNSPQQEPQGQKIKSTTTQ